LDELDEKPNHTKFSKFKNYLRKGLQGKGLVFKTI
jgi:hypothetical protein